MLPTRMTTLADWGTYVVFLFFFSNNLFLVCFCFCYERCCLLSAVNQTNVIEVFNP